MGSEVGPEVSRKENNKESGHITLCWELRLFSCKKEKGWGGGCVEKHLVLEAK